MQLQIALNNRHLEEALVQLASSVNAQRIPVLRRCVEKALLEPDLSNESTATVSHLDREGEKFIAFVPVDALLKDGPFSRICSLASAAAVRSVEEIFLGNLLAFKAGGSDPKQQALKDQQSGKKGSVAIRLDEAKLLAGVSSCLERLSQSELFSVKKYMTTVLEALALGKAVEMPKKAKSRRLIFNGGDPFLELQSGDGDSAAAVFSVVAGLNEKSLLTLEQKISTQLTKTLSAR